MRCLYCLLLFPFLLDFGIHAQQPPANSPPQAHDRLTDNANDDLAPEIAVDFEGNTHVTWYNQGNIFYLTRDRQGTIQSGPLILYNGGTTTLGADYFSHIAVDQYGNAHVVIGLKNQLAIVYYKLNPQGQVVIAKLIPEQLVAPGFILQFYLDPCIAIDPTTSLPVVGVIVRTGTFGLQLLGGLFGTFNWMYTTLKYPNDEVVKIYKLDTDGKVLESQNLFRKTDGLLIPFWSSFLNINSFSFI
jgi:hypothetical protein